MPSKPKVAILNYSPPGTTQSVERRQHYAKFGAVIISLPKSIGAAAHVSFCSYIRSINPACKIFNYNLQSETSTSPTSTDNIEVYNKVQAEDWWVETVTGTKTRQFAQSGRYDVNFSMHCPTDSLGKRWNRWKAEWDAGRLPAGAYDGSFLDNMMQRLRKDPSGLTGDWDLDGDNETYSTDPAHATNLMIKAGNQEYMDWHKSLRPDRLLMGNIDIGIAPAFGATLEYAFMEGVLGASYSLETYSTFDAMMAIYEQVCAAHDYVVFNVHLASATDYKMMRYGLATCLLEGANSYYCARAGSSYENLSPWFDEYDVQLGAPIEDKALVTGIWIRRYEHGCVLVNPSKTDSATIDLSAEVVPLKRFSGSQAPTVNTGAEVTSVNLGPRDGLILVTATGEPLGSGGDYYGGSDGVGGGVDQGETPVGTTVYPMWSFAPNWDNGVLERMEWKTDVLVSATSHEQRIPRRLTPRLSYEASFMVQRENRQYLDVLLSVYKGSLWQVPVFHEVAILTATAEAGTDALTFNTDYLSSYKAGGFVFLRGPDARTWEVAEVASVASGGLTLISNLTATWRAGTFVYPICLATLEDCKISKKTDTFVIVNAKFDLKQSNPYASNGLSLVSYRDYPVWNMRPDDSEDLDFEPVRNILTHDNDIAIPERMDLSNVGFWRMGYRWGFNTKLKHDYLRRLMYALKGRAGSMWVPTFMEDFTLTENIAAGTTIDVKNSGYTAHAGRVEGRQDIRIELWDGTAYYRRIEESAEMSTTVERLVLDTAMPAIDKSLVRSISYMTRCRLDQDTVEIDHRADANGLTVCAVTWYGPVRFEDNTSLTDTWPGPIAALDCDCGFTLSPSCGVEVPLWTHALDNPYQTLGSIGFSLDQPYPVHMLYQTNSPTPGRLVCMIAQPAASEERQSIVGVVVNPTTNAHYIDTGFSTPNVMIGVTDVTCTVIKHWDNDDSFAVYNGANLAQTNFNVPNKNAFLIDIFARRGPYMVFGKKQTFVSRGTTEPRLYVGTPAGGELSVSIELPISPYRLAIGPGVIYVFGTNQYIYTYDIETLEEVEPPFFRPVTAFTGSVSIMTNESGTLWCTAHDEVFKRVGDEWIRYSDLGDVTTVHNTLHQPQTAVADAIFNTGPGWHPAWIVPCPPEE
jgi:hypothetical protein